MTSLLNRCRLMLLMAMLVLCGMYADAGELRFIWDSKEKSKLDKLERKIEKDGVDDQRFYTYETDNWNIKCQISARFAAEAGLYMDMFYELLNDTFGVETGRAPTKGTFYIFDTKDQYAKKAKSNDSTSAFRWSGKDGEFTQFEMYTYMDPKDGRAQMNFEYCRHESIRVEATRAFLQSKVGPRDFPDWFLCGLSKFYGYWDVRDTFKTTSQSKAKSARKNRLSLWPLAEQICEYVKENRDLPRLHEMMEMDRAAWNKNNYRNWVICSSIADCLLSTKNGCNLVDDMILRLSKGEEPILLPEEAYDLEKDWYEFLRDGWRLSTPPAAKEYLRTRKKP